MRLNATSFLLDLASTVGLNVFLKKKVHGKEERIGNRIRKQNQEAFTERDCKELLFQTMFSREQGLLRVLMTVTVYKKTKKLHLDEFCKK